MITIKISWFHIVSREEQQKRQDEVLHHYFRYGVKHRSKVGKLLEELVPGEKREHLILYYLQIKDGMEKNGGQNFEEAVKQIDRKCIIITTDKTIQRYYKAVMEADLQIKEDLVLPSAEEIRQMVRQGD